MRRERPKDQDGGCCEKKFSRTVIAKGSICAVRPVQPSLRAQSRLRPQLYVKHLIKASCISCLRHPVTHFRGIL